MGIWLGMFLVLWLAAAVAIIFLELRRPKSEAKLLLVFVENNEENVEALLWDICHKARHDKSRPYVLVIDNCSTDATVPIISRLKRYFSQIEIVARSEPGYMTPEQLKLLLDNVLRVIDLTDVAAPLL